MQKKNKNCFIIAISGATTSGKSTLSDLLIDIYDCSVIHQDKYFNYPKIKSQLNGNHELAQALFSDNFYNDILLATKTAKKNILIIQGFLLFTDARIVELANIKIFLDIDLDTLHYRRMKVNPCSEDYFRKCITPCTLSYRQLCQNIQGVIILDAKQKIVTVLSKTKEIIKNALNII